jgi:hypothetical protein
MLMTQAFGLKKVCKRVSNPHYSRTEMTQPRHIHAPAR